MNKKKNSPPLQAQPPAPPVQAASVLAPAQPPSYLPWLLALLAFLLYANTLGHQYAFDDAIVITENQFTKKGIGGWWDLLTRDFFEGIYGKGSMELTGGRYRPLSLLMFALEYQFFGLNPFVGHLLNLLFYAATALLLYRCLAHWLGKDSALPFVTTLLFVVHPLHTEVVANIKSRDEILSLFFVLGFFRLAQKASLQSTNSLWWRYWGLALGSFALALLAKESAFVMVLLYPLANWVFEQHRDQRWIAVLALGLAYFALRSALVGTIGQETNPDIMENPFVGADFQEKYATIGVILWKYVSLLFWPHPLSSDYSFNQIPRTHFGDPLALLGWAIHIGLFGAAIWGLRKKAIWAWGIMLYLAPFGLVSNILFNIGAPMGERFLYLGSFGACLALSQGLLYQGSTWTAFRSKSLLGLGLIALAGLFSVLTFQRNKAWYNNETLFGTDVKHVPNSAKIHYYYGNTLLQKFLNSPKDRRNPALLEQAEKSFVRSVEINPKFHTAWYNVGLVAFEKGDGPKSKTALLQTLSLQPKHLNSTELLAKVYARFFNQPDSALIYQERFVYEWKQETPESLKNLAILYSMKNQMDKAEPLFEKALKLAPNDASILFNYGVALQANGYMPKGTELVKKAQQLDPSLGK